VIDSTLAGRGWVQQELLLAPRILYFSQQETFWECSSFSACERHPSEAIPYDVLVRSTRKDKSFESPNIWNKLAGSQEHYFEFYRTWWAIVRQYTKCNFTYLKDVFPAIAGLARQMKTGLGDHDDYLCGLWTRHLALHLLWSVEDGHQRERPQ
jgi:hypothetical protein